MKIKILNNRFFLLVFLVSIFIVQFGCLKKSAQTNLIDQKTAESQDLKKPAAETSDVKQDSLADTSAVTTVNPTVEPASETKIVNNDPLILINDNKQSKSVIENIPSLEEIANNASNSEIFEEDTTEVLNNKIDNKKQDEPVSSKEKDGKTLIQEHYSRALSLYDAGEYDKSKEELKICLKMTADLDLDIETLFRFGDVYKDVFESTSAQEPPPEQNTAADTAVLDINITQEEKKIVEDLGKDEVKYDFPVEFNEEVKRYIKLYVTKNHKAMMGRLPRSSKYIDMMKEVFKNEGLPQDLAYLPMIESAYKVKAYSRAGAGGLWQFMRKTGQKYGLRSDWSIDERYDPIVSTKAAAKYLKDLYKIFDSWVLAEAAYNAGEFRILRAMGIAVSRDFWNLASKNILARETRGYVADFMANLIIAKNPEKYGFTNIPYEKPLEYDEVVIENCMDLSFAAKLTECPIEEIKALNPALLKWCTPIDYPKFVLRVPKGKADAFKTNLTKIAKADSSGKVGWAQHVVKSGETMSTISIKYGIPIESIAKANNIGNINRITVGTRLFIPYGKNSSSDDVAGVKGDSGYKKIEYVVQAGDTLWDIGKKYNITLDKIREWNEDFSGREHIFPGEKIAIWVKEEEM